MGAGAFYSYVNVFDYITNQDNYQKCYNSLAERHEEKKVRYHELTAAIAEKQAKSEIIKNFIKTIKKMDGMVEIFDEGLWCEW